LVSSRVYPEQELQYIAGELRSPETAFSQPPAAVYQAASVSAQRGTLGQAYPPTVGDFIVEPPLNLGNSKPETKFNISLGTFNPPQETDEQ
jgi:hypothetical protein